MPSPPFEEVFELVEVIELGEDPSDSIAAVGEFVERRDGGFIVADRYLPRVRTYRADGSLQPASGASEMGRGSSVESGAWLRSQTVESR